MRLSLVDFGELRVRELPRIPLPRTRVNKEEGRSGYTPASIEGLLERAVTVGQIRIGLA